MKFLCIGIEDIGFRAGLNLNSEIRLVVGQSLHELHILVSGQEDLTNSLNVLLLNTRCRHELLRYVRLYICQHLRHRGFLSVISHKIPPFFPKRYLSLSIVRPECIEILLHIGYILFQLNDSIFRINTRFILRNSNGIRKAIIIISVNTI